MADNIAITAGTGTTIATDDIGGVMYQRVKLSIGADGSATDVSAAAQMPVTTKAKYVDVTLSTLETAALADGDIMCVTTEVTGAFTNNDGTGVIQSIHVLDEADQGVAFDLVFFSANTSLGTANAAPSISDADARTILGRVRVNAADYIDLGGSRTATLTGVGLGVKSGSGVDDMWVSAISRGAPTYAAATDLKLRIYVAND